jgi:hypothetical protein
MPARLRDTGVVAGAGHGIVGLFVKRADQKDGGPGHKSGCGVNGLRGYHAAVLLGSIG